MSRIAVAIAVAVRTAGVVLATGGIAAAQGPGERDPVELQRAQRAMQQNRAEVDRLLDLRLRHDLGILPKDQGDEMDRTFRPVAPVTTETMERMQKELEVEDTATATMRDQYEKLRAAVERLRNEAAAKAKADAEPQAFVSVPSAGRQAPPSRAGAPAPAPAPTNPVPGGETAASARAIDPVAADLTLDPLRAQIHGSTDHQRVAMALFRAGQALMDRAAAAREQDQLAVARELDDRGRERVRRALDELAPLLQQKQPPFEALFCRGRALELLFRYSERHENLDLGASARDWQRREQEVRQPFLEITARDVRKAGPRGETEVLGPWGTAAQAALEHFRWMNLHARYDARAAIGAITWPGEKEP